VSWQVQFQLLGLGGSMKSDIPSKADLLIEIHREWDRLNALVGSLNEAQLTAPRLHGGWSVKDALAHISAWEKVLLDRLGETLSGQPGHYPPVLSDTDVEQANAGFFAESQGRSLPVVLQEFRSVYTGVLTAVEALDEGLLAHPLRIDYPQDDLHVWEIIRANTSDHYQEHRQAIEAWLKEA
jgi:hypothetical protein